MKMPNTQLEFVPFGGGLDLVTPPLLMQPGKCRGAQNFELDTQGGYVSTSGYERFDGRTAPSSATYVNLPATVTTAFPSMASVTGSVSGATGVVAYWEDGTVIVTKVVGTFVNGESLLVSAAPYATVTDTPVFMGGASPERIAFFTLKAANVYRADITAPAGDGHISGILWHNSTAFCVRANGASAVFYKSTSSGWQAIPYDYSVSFSNAGLITEGMTLTRGGATATINRIIVQTGTLGAANTGLMYVTPISGSITSGAATAGGISLTLTSSASQVSMIPGGRFRFVKYNFGSGYRVYGCDGMNKAFEFDGDHIYPITTGMSPDNPTHVAAHKNHLFLTFDQSLQHSAIGNPFDWTVISGAGELALGDTITNLLPMPGDNVAGGAMACFTRQRTYMLYGNSSADWQLVTQREDTGAIAHTAQFVDTCYVLDNRGVTTLQSTDAFGNFASSSLTQLIRPWVMENKTRAIDSCVLRDRNQYRVLFSGGRVLVMTMTGNAIAGFMTLLLKHDMTLVAAFDDESGDEVLLYGGDDGMVYMGNKGTSFDGEDIDCALLLAYNHSKSPRLLKQYRKAVFEIGGNGYSRFFFAADIAYLDFAVPQSAAADLNFGDYQLGQAFWDAANWDTSVWDGSSLLPAEVNVDGIGQNIGLRLYSTSNTSNPISFYGAMLHYTPRRQMR